jgi:hypothetical protein
VIATEIESSSAPAKRLDKPRDDWTPEIVTLKHMAWILPALRLLARQCGDDLSRWFLTVSDDVRHGPPDRRHYYDPL